MEVPTEESQDEKKVIEGTFSQEFHMDRKDVVKFLRKLADEIEEDRELKITTDEWELPFTIRDQVEVEIDLDYSELEIELEFEEYEDDDSLSVE